MPRFFALALLILPALASGAAAARPDGQLELTIVDEATGQPLAARMVLRNSHGRSVVTRGVGDAPLGDHFYVDGQVILALRRGQYTFDLDAGPEYHPQQGHFEILRRSEDTTEVQMRRAVDLQKEGWLGADLDAPRSTGGLAIAMRGEGLAHHAHLRWRRNKNKWAWTEGRQPRDAQQHAAHAGAAWETEQGSLRFYHPVQPIDTGRLKLIDEVSAPRLVAMKEQGWRVVAGDLTDWRLPIWLAYDALDAVMVIDRASLAKRPPRTEPGFPRDKNFYPGASGVGRWREAIYFHALNAGLQLPPVAGSGSGASELPLGTARVYAQTHGEQSPTAWWNAVNAGATFVTTGPLLRPTVEGHTPGRVFYLTEGEETEFQIALSLTTRDPIEYLELIKNGQVSAAVPLRDVAAQGGRLPPLAFDGPGWFTVRAVTTSGDIYHRAMSAPYYVTQNDTPRISAKSCQFFLDWIDQLSKQASADGMAEEIAQAKAFWSERLTKANTP